MAKLEDSCVGCGLELCYFDNDPNGAVEPLCARCRAEEEHDFDAEPDAVFDRTGKRIK